MLRYLGWAACCVFALLGPANGSAYAGDFTRHVNPFIGTDGTGHVFPGATRPFGMVAPSPDNADTGWSYSSGYQFRAPRIMGFSNTHISGAGIGELGDVLLQPAQSRRWRDGDTDFSTAYDKRSEAARPGYYTVRLPRHHVTVELTATRRVAFQRYRFDRPGSAQVMADLQHGILFTKDPRVVASDVRVDAAAGEISGTIHSRNWVERQASFVVRFSQPITHVTTLSPRLTDKAPRYVLDFDLGKGRELLARVALSTVDVDGARRNLAVDADKAFEEVRTAADAEWDELLSRIRIEGSQKQKRIFYSALYRTLMHPSEIADVDGRVRGPTGEVVAARGGYYYSTLSLWDTFRAVHPLVTLLVPERVDGMINTLLQHHQAQGYLPLWTAWGRETHTMIGNPALPVIADALAKGFTGFPADEALRAMVETSTKARPNAPQWAQRDWLHYERFGYLPFDLEVDEAVSKSLEYGVGDAAVAQVAQQLGQHETARRFHARAQGYRKLWDANTGMMRGRDSAGAWREPFDPLIPTSPMNNPGDYTEANAWQYSLTPALHDPDGMVGLMGGDQAFERWLDRFFSVRGLGDNKHLGQEAMIGQYAHGNEPSHHIAWLYAWTASPQKGQALVRRIAREFYKDSPDGLIGNDDCGQMSAWYVFATLGLYPVVPASAHYVISTPLAKRVHVRLPSGEHLEIQSVKNGPARLNGRAINPRALAHDALVRGGRLELPITGSPQ